jgi:LacI family transcriptional regulator
MIKPTIFEVARVAGVSTGTVSRALNNRAGVNVDTRAKVLEVVEQLGYVPDVGARQLARRSRTVIGITRFTSNSLRNPYYTLLVDLIQEALVDGGYVVRILENDDPGNCAGVIVPGVHLTDSRPEELRRRKIPFVVISDADNIEHDAWVEVDNRFGMQQVMQHLIGLGHWRIAHLTGGPIDQTAPMDLKTFGQTAQVRLEAYRAVLEESNLKFDPALVLDGQFSELGAYRAIMQALESGLQFTALACASDEMALGAMQALEDRGLHIPEDISVTGFDDLPLESVRSCLTTVHQPLRLLGHTAATIMLELLEGKPARGQLLPVRLVVRSSSGPVRAEGR